MFVWNSEHEKAIVDYHQIPRSRISISGAPQFDQWFDRKGPSVSKEQFCSAIGVNPESLFVLYIASSSAGARNSDAIKAIREAMDANNHKLIREAVLVVRPYPGIEKYSEVVGYQRIANLPAPAESRRTLNDDLVFFDAVYYSLVTIAVDSTAFIDSMVINRPCIVYNDPKFFDVQNAEHFALILESGALYHARSAKEIAEFCASIIQSGDTQSLARKKYIENLVRPRGLERNVGDIIVDEVERLI